MIHFFRGLEIHFYVNLYQVQEKHIICAWADGLHKILTQWQALDRWPALLPDAIFCDYHMPNAAGLDVASADKINPLVYNAS